MECYYCGEPAVTTDHVLPRTIARALQAHDLNVEKRRRNILTVPACRECNTLLGTSYQPTLRERKEYLKKRLKKRYRQDLRMPDWSEEEIAELGHDLQGVIRQGLYRRHKARERLRH